MLSATRRLSGYVTTIKLQTHCAVCQNRQCDMYLIGIIVDMPASSKNKEKHEQWRNSRWRRYTMQQKKSKRSVCRKDAKNNRWTFKA
eukprot:scaffold244240_cov17-Prasinocladus_malaysianus.AAC.1